MAKYDYTLTYYFDDNGEPWDYYITRSECLDALVELELVTQEQIDKLEDDLDLIDDLLDDYDDDLKDYFLDEAKDQYDDEESERKDPYGYRGISPKDFY